MSKKSRKASKLRTRKTSTDNMEAGQNYELMKRYIRRSACSAAAGLGAFGLAVESGDAAIHSVAAPLFLQKSLVGDPSDMAPIESLDNPGTFPFRSIGWADEGFGVQYGSYVSTTYAFGIDIDLDGTPDANFFRGANFGGYLMASTNKVGYYGGSVYGSGDVQLLSNLTDNPDTDGVPADPGGALKPALQGFNAGEIIGDGNDVSLGAYPGTMRRSGYPGDWDGVPNNDGNLYGSGGPAPLSSYVGFEISNLTTGTGSGFGWIEVVVREPAAGGFDVPELQIIGWAFTDDGSSIVAGDTGGIPGDFNEDGEVSGADFLQWQRQYPALGASDLADWGTNYGAGGSLLAAAGAVPEPSSLALLAAGAGALAFRRKRSTGQ